jgi:predicted DNA binding CopG/RHH family protein
MTPTDEATFIALWQQGLSQDAIAQHLGIPIGTVKSRAHTLAHAGKLIPRPRGGAYPRQKALARPEDPPAPARAPAPPPADSALPTRAPPAITFLAVPEVRELIQTVKDLVARVAALEEGTRDGTRTPGTIKQWTVRLSQPLIEAVKAQAATEGKEPSHLVEELLSTALSERRSTMP